MSLEEAGRTAVWLSHVILTLSHKEMYMGLKVRSKFQNPTVLGAFIKLLLS